MHTVEILETNKMLFIPEKLSECTPKQLASISYYIYLLKTKKLTYGEFQTHCIYALLNMKKSDKDYSVAQEEIINANLIRLFVLLDGFFIEENGAKKTFQDFKENPLPYIPSPWHNFKGPKDIFYTTFGEYVDALDAFGAYQKVKDDNILIDLVASFYRPHVFGARLPKSERTKNLVKKQLKKTYFGYIYAFYIYFSGFQDRMATQRVMVEGQEIDFSLLFKPEKDHIPSQINGLGIKSHAYVLAESGVFGNLEKVNNTPTIEIILRMYDIKKRDLDQKAHFKREQQKQKK